MPILILLRNLKMPSLQTHPSVIITITASPPLVAIPMRQGTRKRKAKHKIGNDEKKATKRNGKIS